MHRYLKSWTLLTLIILTGCGGGQLSLPADFISNKAGALRIFRSGDALPREVLAGVYPGDVVKLEVHTSAASSSLIWSSSDPLMGQISQSGELKILKPGIFYVQVRDGSIVQSLVVHAGAERPYDGEENPAPENSPAPSPLPSPSPVASPAPTETPTASPAPSPSPVASPSPSPVPQNSPPPSVASDPFIDEVVSFEPGPHAGFGANQLPGIVLGAPRGTGEILGSFHVLALGVGGRIVVKSATPILNGTGPDFIVFENAFFANGDPQAPFAEPAEIAVSQDGVHFVAYPCEPANAADLYPGCGGVRPVYANSVTNGIDPTDPARAGGDAFDLQALGLEWAQWIRIRDLSSTGEGTSAGFDLDAISIMHQ